jgi:hypothetical protein
MSRYFFNLSNGHILKDVVGESFDLLVHARDHAVQVARELAGGMTSGRSISVTDEKGVVVFKTEIPDELVKERIQ